MIGPKKACAPRPMPNRVGSGIATIAAKWFCLDLSPGAQEPGKAPKEIWTVDMISKFGVFPHNMTASSIIAWNDYIYVITGNGVDDTHKHVVAPQAPGIICFDKNNGKMIWSSNIAGPNVLHGQWASVSIAEVNGRTLAIAPLGDAWVYAFDAKTGEIVWKFDTNPKEAVYPQTRQRDHLDSMHRWKPDVHRQWPGPPSTARGLAISIAWISLARETSARSSIPIPMRPSRSRARNC